MIKERRNPSSKEIDKLEEQVRKTYEGYLSAPIYVVVLTDSKLKYPSYNSHDWPLAAGYLMLAQVFFATYFDIEEV